MKDKELNCTDCWCRYCVNNIAGDTEFADFFCEGCEACAGKILEDPDDCPHKAYKGDGDVEVELNAKEQRVSCSEVLATIIAQLQDEYWEKDTERRIKELSENSLEAGFCIGLSRAISLLKEYEKRNIITVYDLQKCGYKKTKGCKSCVSEDYMVRESPLSHGELDYLLKALNEPLSPEKEAEINAKAERATKQFIENLESGMYDDRNSL